MIYLDYSANTPVDPRVLETFVNIEGSYIGNPNASHLSGAMAMRKMEEVTDSVAGLLNVLPSEIIYTSGASEANNLAIKGIARAQRNYGKHIISTVMEHPSVSAPLTWLQEQGYEIDLVNIGRDGKIDTEHLKELLRDETILVAITAVDSELGVIQPIREITEIIRANKNCRLHVDATQAIGKVPFSFDGIDTASVGAHKIYGINGSGFLFKRKEIVLEPLIHGGYGMSIYRSGTPTLSLAAALCTALRISTVSIKERYDLVRELNDRLRKAFFSYPSVVINSPEDAVPHILNVSVPGIKGVRMQRMLSEQGVCVSVKSACSTDTAPSKTVFAISRDRKRALSSWRISLSHLTTKKEISDFLEILEKCISDAQSEVSADEHSANDSNLVYVDTSVSRSGIEVAYEHAVSVFINGRAAMKIVCTPDHIDELIIGRFLTEGFIDGIEEISNITVSKNGLVARVELTDKTVEDLSDEYIDTVQTCCTDNRIFLHPYDRKMNSLKPIEWNKNWIDDISERLAEGEPLYNKTRAVHACYLAMEDHVICVMEDIGRHNALDKVIGYGLINNIDLTRCYLFTTGRMPADMVNKVIKAGVPMLVSKTYPTDKAIRIAEEFRLTLITRCRQGSLVIWTDGKGKE